MVFWFFPNRTTSPCLSSNSVDKSSFPLYPSSSKCCWCLSRIFPNPEAIFYQGKGGGGSKCVPRFIHETTLKKLWNMSGNMCTRLFFLYTLPPLYRLFKKRHFSSLPFFSPREDCLTCLHTDTHGEEEKRSGNMLLPQHGWRQNGNLKNGPNPDSLFQISRWSLERRKKWNWKKIRVAPYTNVPFSRKEEQTLLGHFHKKSK